MLASKWVSAKVFFIELWGDENQISESWQKILSRILVYITGFFLFEKIVFRTTTIPFEKYYKGSIFFEVISHNYLNIFLILSVALILVKFRAKFFHPWKDLNNRQVRIFVLTIITLLAWQYSVYDFNYYFNNWHVWDRLLLILLAFATFWRPIFSLPFLLVLFPIIGQFEVLPGFSMAAPLLLIRMVILFLVFLISAVLFKKFNHKEFIFLVGCLIAAHYFASGIRKLAFDWVISDHINYLLPNTYTNGWFSFMDGEWVSKTTRGLEYLNFPLRIFTLFVECGIILFFFKKKLSKIFLISIIGFHIGITVYTGIFFWNWILIALLVLVLFINNSDQKIQSLFGKRYFLISIVLILSGELWCKPVPLTWSDVPFNYTYKFKAILDNGTTLNLPPHYFSPYSYQFTLSNFKFLHNKKRLEVVWGATQSANGKLYNSITSDKELFEKEELLGSTSYNSKEELALKSHIQKFVRNWNSNHRMRNDYLGLIQPPRLLMTYPKKEFRRTNEKIVAIEVFEITSFYSEKEGYRKIREIEITEIPTTAIH